jgi:5-methylcytosine-specific restriction endonuclease McrA
VKRSPDAKLATELYGAGMSQKEIGKLLGFSQAGIGNALRRAGVPCRKGGPKRGHRRSDEFKRKSSISKLGPKNPNWKGDAIERGSGRDRARRAYRSIGPCSNCGAPKTERHHIDGNTLNNNPENIAILCRRCHMIADGRLQSLLSRLGEMCQAAAIKKRGVAA